MPPNAKFCEKELTKIVPGGRRGCGGCNPLEGIDCYVLECTKNNTICKN